MLVYQVFIFFFLCGSGVSVSFLTRLLSVSFKWHTIYTALLSIVYPPDCFINVISWICCHSFLLCVTHMSSILSVLIVLCGCICGP